METITINGVDENAFRCSIEEMLRQDRVTDAARTLRALLEPYAGENRILPSRFLTVSSDELRLAGWERLGERIGSYDRPNHHISALGIAVSEPEGGGGRPDETGKLTPFIQTSYYSDDAYPFSEAARDDLLEGYSVYGCEWQGNCEETDSTLSVEGLDDLYGAIAQLEARLLSSSTPRADDIRAGSLGACYLAVLIHQAVRDSIERDGLPRPLCVMAGSNGVYPFFDAPVMSSEECLENGSAKPAVNGQAITASAAVEAIAEETSDAAAGYNSLLSCGIRKGKKKPVIMLDPAEAEAAARMGDLAAAQVMADAVEPGRTRIAVSLDALDTEAHPAPFAEIERDREPEDIADEWEFEEPAEPEPQDFGNEPYRPETFAPEAEFPPVGAGDLASEPDDEPLVFEQSGQTDPGDAWTQPDDADADPALPGEPEPEPFATSLDRIDFAPLEEKIDDLLASIGSADTPDERPAAIDETPGADNRVQSEPISEPPPLPAATPRQPSPKPDAHSSGHRLRARIRETEQPRVTFMDRLVAFLGWLHERLTGAGK